MCTQVPLLIVVSSQMMENLVGKLKPYHPLETILLKTKVSLTYIKVNNFTKQQMLL